MVPVVTADDSSTRAREDETSRELDASVLASSTAIEGTSGGHPTASGSETMSAREAGVDDEETTALVVDASASDKVPDTASQVGSESSTSSRGPESDGSIVTLIDASIDAPSGATSEPQSSWTTDYSDTFVADPDVCNAGEFGEPQLVVGLGFDDRLWGPAISSDGNLLLFGYTGTDEDLFMASAQVGDGVAFHNVTALSGLNTGSGEGTPFLSYDGLSLYFYANREGGPGDRDLWFSTRASVDDDFEAAEQVPGVNGGSYDHLPWLSDDERRIYYTTERDGGLGRSDIWTASRASKTEPFSGHELVRGINTEHREDAIAFSPDRLTVYFTTDRATDGDLDIWRATRKSRSNDFGDAEEVVGLNSDTEDTNLALTRDGKRLYFSSGRGGKQRLWVATRTCQ